jgi:hypothetical protein
MSHPPPDPSGQPQFPTHEYLKVLADRALLWGTDPDANNRQMEMAHTQLAYVQACVLMDLVDVLAHPRSQAPEPPADMSGLGLDMSQQGLWSRDPKLWSRTRVPHEGSQA